MALIQTTFAETARREADALIRRHAELASRDYDVRNGPSDPLDMLALRDRYDNTYKELGAGAAPQPLPSESPFSYRRRLASEIAHMSPTWKGSNLFVVGDDVLDTAEPTIISDARAYVADRTRPNPDGTLREMQKVNDHGHHVTEFAGSPLSWLAAFSGPRFAVNGFKAKGQPIRIQRRSL
jgi:hypothetical protein